MNNSMVDERRWVLATLFMLSSVLLILGFFIDA
jgi:hypothetical protein